MTSNFRLSAARLALFAAVIVASGAGSAAPGPPPGLRAAVLDGSYKTRPAGPLPANTGAISLEGARNEYELAQVVLWSSEALRDVFVELTPLSGPAGSIPAQDTELFLAHYVTVDKATDALGQSGEWPDALVPLRQPFALRPGRHQPVLLKVFLRPGLGAGSYRGRLLVAAKGAPALAIEVAVEVWDITLPARVSLPVMTGVDYESIRKFEGGLPDPAFEARIVPKYYAALHRQRAYPLFLHNGAPEVRQESGKLVVEFDSFKRRLDAAIPAAAAAPVGIPFFDSWPIDTKRHALFSPEYRRQALDYLRQIAAFYEQEGRLERAFLYIPGTDEPSDRRKYDEVRRFAELLRASDSRLRMALTVFTECRDCAGEGLDSLESGAVLWVPNFAFFDGRALRARQRLFGLLGLEFESTASGWTPELAQRVRQRGGEIWWYLNPWTMLLPAAQQPAYPNIYIDHQGIEHRVLGWMAFRHRVAALAHWNATFWSKTTDPWVRLPRGEENPENPPIAGDGSLLYPAAGSSRYTGQPDPDGPLASLRLEMLREGSEDYELLALLGRRGQEALAMEISAGIVKSLQDFERRPSEYRLARRRVAAALVNAGPATPARRP